MSAKKTKQPEHSRIGGSSAPRWIRCPGSVKQCAKLKNETSEYAREGTAAHKLAELGLLEKKEVTIADKTRMPKDLKKYVNMDMVDYVNYYINIVLDVLNEKESNQLFVEQRFSLEHIHQDMFGTNDAIVLEAVGTMHVFDLKYGVGVRVKAEQNEQMMFYAVGAVHKFCEAIIEEVNIVIVQPRASEYPSAWKIPIEQLESWETDTLAPAAKLTDDPEAPIVPGDHCSSYFCSALTQGTCPGPPAKASEVIGSDVTTTDPTELNLTDPTELSANEVANILNVSGLIKTWLTNIEGMAKDRLLAGVPVPGRKLVQGKQGNRKWKDESEVAKTIQDIMPDADVYAAPKLKSPAQMEKVKEFKKTKIMELIPTLVCRAPGKPMMVPDTDARPALELFAESADEDGTYDFLGGIE
jgi:hypothetical protein